MHIEGRGTSPPPVVLAYESHGQDARYRPMGDVCETVSAKYGMGGGNAPIILTKDENLY